MSKGTQKLFEQIQQPEQPVERIGAIEAAVLGVQAIAPGLSLGQIWDDIKHEAKHQLAAGAHELSAALFTGSAFVMYSRSGHDGGEQGKAVEGPESPSATPEVERDSGMER